MRRFFAWLANLKLQARHVIIGTLAVSAPRYMAAFIVSDAGELTGAVSTIATVLIGASGVGLGLVEVAGTSVIIDGWKKRLPGNNQKGSKPFKLLTAILLSTCALSLIILVPFTVARLQGRAIAEVMGWFGWLWALAVNLDPFVILAGVAYCQKGETHKRTHKRESLRVSERKASGSKSAKSYKCEICGKACQSSQALASHMRWNHKKKG